MLRKKFCYTVSFVLSLLAGCAQSQGEVVCPSIFIPPHAFIKLSTPLSEAGRYDLSLDVDGKKEECSLEVSNVGGTKEMGGVVQSPSTQTKMTCTTLSIKGLSSEGYIIGFQSTRDTTPPKALSMKISRDGKTLGEGSYTFSYKPTELLGAGCPTTNYAEETLTFQAKP